MLQGTGGSDRFVSDILESCAGLEERQVAAGSVLLTEGSRSGRLFVLISGEMHILRGDIEIAHVREPGAVFGEMSVFLDAPHTASVQAATDCRVYVIEDAETYLAARPDMLRHIARLLALRLQLASGYLADIKRQFSDNRDHLGMVDEVLESLLHQPETTLRPGSDSGSSRDTDPRL